MSTTALPSAPSAASVQGGPAPAPRATPRIVYTGRPVALASAHSKALVLGEVFAVVGLHLVEVPVDTDRLGTFTGEVSRQAGLFDTAVAKARLGQAASGLALGVGSEGSFAPDPVTGAVVQREAVAWVDGETGIVVVGRAGRHAPWTRSWTLARGEDPAALVADLDLTSHRLTVRPEPDAATPDAAALDAGAISKGLADLGSLRAAVSRALEVCDLVRIETDLRSHVCPQRHQVMREAALDLVLRLHTACPACHRPGFGPEDRAGNAPCRSCGTPTQVRTDVVDRCPTCEHSELRPTGVATADPSRCASCNP